MARAPLDEDGASTGAAAVPEVGSAPLGSLYQTMFERGSLGQLIVDFASFRIVEVNPALCTMTGFAAEALVGSDVAMIFPQGRSPAANTAERLADGAVDGYSVDRLLKRRDGTVVPVLSTVSAVRGGDGKPVHLLVVMQDVSSQRATEQAQRRGQAVIDAAIAALPVTFTTLDSELRFTSIAGGLERRHALPDDLLGRHVSEITDDPAAFRGLRAALAGFHSTTPTVVDGTTHMTLNAPMRDEAGVVVGVTSVTSDITADVAAEDERRRVEEQTLFAAQHDPLTGLPGRSALIEHLNALASSGHGAGALLLLDLDDFNLVNDSLGHEVGDAVLLEVAGRVSAAFPGLMVARYGGDEFAVVAPLSVDRAEAVEAAERVHAILDADVEFAGHALRVSASVGLALEEPRASTSSLIRNADSALAHAKNAGAGQYRVYDDDMRRQVRHRLAIQDGLRVALGSGQLHPVYQPIVDLLDRRIVGFEALLRWSHPEWGPVAPAEFIPIAEQSGLIVPIGQWVMNTACEDVLPIQRAHGMYVAVNVSTRQLIVGGFAEWVEDVLRRTGLPPGALTVEVTESAFMDDIGPIQTAFDRLRCLGVRLSIDDFGTGYSSLARLQALPVDVIKLDRAFVTHIEGRPKARGMAAAILQLSAAIGAQTVAEGIETEAEAAALRGLGYTMGQGYLFARPMPIEELAARLGGLAPRLCVQPTPSADPQRRRRAAGMNTDGEADTLAPPMLQRHRTPPRRAC